MEMDIQIFGKQRSVLCAGKARLLGEICPDKRRERATVTQSITECQINFTGASIFFPRTNAENGSRNVCLLLKVHLNPGVGISGNWVVTQFFWRQDDDTVVDRKLKLGTFVSTPP